MSTTKLDFDQTGFHTWIDDFDTYTAAHWTVTTTEDGTGSATEAISDADGGVLLLTNAAGDDDRDFLQFASETFTFETGKALFFKARFKVSDATDSDLVMGLQVTDTTPLAASDGIWFQKDDGDALLDFHVAASSSQTDAIGVATLADDTWTTVAFYYDGSNANIKYIVDDVVLGNVALTNAPSTELTISFGVQNGAAAVKTMSVDFITAVKER